MKTRVITGTLIGVFTVVFGVIGGMPLAVVLLVCGEIGYFELCRALGLVDGKRPTLPAVPGIIAAAAYFIGMPLLCAKIDLDFYTLMVLSLLLVVLLALYVFRFPTYQENQITAAMFSFLYCPLLMGFIYRLRALPNGIYLVALLIFCTWGCDTCAYFSGRALGKHKMAPVLSPKKTWEGSFGGMLGSMILCFVLSVVLKILNPSESAAVLLFYPLIGLAGSVAAQIGDLAASAIKRNVGIKDYGSLLPGHGGIMDRFDSMLFTTPIVFFLASILMGAE